MCIRDSIQLVSLRDFEMAQNKLTGSLPSGLGQLSLLSVIILSENRLSRTLPPSWGQLSSLRVLELDNNKLSGTVPSSFGLLKVLESLKINDNILSGSIPSALCYLNISAVNVSDNLDLYCTSVCFIHSDSYCTIKYFPTVLPTTSPTPSAPDKSTPLEAIRSHWWWLLVIILSGCLFVVALLSLLYWCLFFRVKGKPTASPLETGSVFVSFTLPEAVAYYPTRPLFYGENSDEERTIIGTETFDI